MKLKINLIEDIDSWGCCEGQEVDCPDNNEVSYRVYNLYECPEDAIIGRALFSADEYLETLALGMKLAAMGYTDLDIQTYTQEEWENKNDN